MTCRTFSKAVTVSLPMGETVRNTAFFAIPRVVIVQIRFAHQCKLWRIGEGSPDEDCLTVGDQVPLAVSRCHSFVDESPVATFVPKFNMSSWTTTDMALRAKYEGSRINHRNLAVGGFIRAQPNASTVRLCRSTNSDIPMPLPVYPPARAYTSRWFRSPAHWATICSRCCRADGLTPESDGSIPAL
jgi:hypothetical protein